MLPVLLKQIVPCTLWTACSAYFLNKMFLILHEKKYFTDCVLLKQIVLCTPRTKCFVYSSIKMLYVLLKQNVLCTPRTCFTYFSNKMFWVLLARNFPQIAYSSSKLFRVLLEQNVPRCSACSLNKMFRVLHDHKGSIYFSNQKYQKYREENLQNL